MRKKQWEIGDIFLVPISDENYCVGQVIDQQKKALNSVICAFSDIRVAGSNERFELSVDDLISVQFTTRDLLDSGIWKVVKNQTPFSVERFFNVRKFQAEGFVGVRVVGSGSIMKFLKAFFGLYPWDGLHDPEYFDKLLLPSKQKPASVVYKQENS